MKLNHVDFSVTVTVVLLVLVGGHTIASGRRVATVYDILQLIYRLCVAEGDQRSIGLQCVDYHMAADVSEVLERCMAKHKIKGEEPTTTLAPSNETNAAPNTVNGVARLCDKLTLVEEWTEKHTKPPSQLTTVIGIEALGRMTCVMGSVQRPLTTWTAAFSKCFPNQELEWAKSKTKGKITPAGPGSNL